MTVKNTSRSDWVLFLCLCFLWPAFYM